jgi:3-oxoacyl-[acyl-carrier-protein] synthase II
MEMQGKKKVVVTGVGAVSSVGVGADNFFQALVDGKSGIAKMPSWSDEYPAQVGSIVGEEAGWTGPEQWMDKKEARRQGRYTHFAMAAAKIALEDGKLDVTKVDKSKFGVIVGSGIGGVEFFEDNCNKFTAAGEGAAGLKKVSPFLIPALISNTASGIIAIEVGAQGPNYGVVSACATGTHAIGDALFFLQTGRADMMLAGGSEASITPLCFAGFAAMRAMVTTFNDDPLAASRPFDKRRAGFVMGEGAGVLLLETEEHALARGAEIYCELAGYGATCDAHHITAPHPEGRGLAAAITMALETGGVSPDEVDYINAHGTSTPYNDKFETMAIKKALGDQAYKTKISSTKSMIGHTLGAAGGLEAVICAKTVKTGWVPPTLNLDEPDLEDGCDLDYTPKKAVKLDRVRAAISDNLGFGGHNAALVFKEYVKPEKK